MITFVSQSHRKGNALLDVLLEAFAPAATSHPEIGGVAMKDCDSSCVYMLVMSLCGNGLLMLQLISAR
jgi:hypothetical protein